VNFKQVTYYLICDIISTDEDPGLRIESFAVIYLSGVSTNKTIVYFIAMQTYKELSIFKIEKYPQNNTMSMNY
jgi:hypothetical protein